MYTYIYAGAEPIYPVYQYMYKMHYAQPKGNPYTESIENIFKRCITGDLTMPAPTYIVPYRNTDYINFYVGFSLSHFLTILSFLRTIDKSSKIIYISTTTHTIVPNILADWYGYDIYYFNIKPHIYYTSKKIKYFNRFPTTEDYKQYKGNYLINTVEIIGPINTTYYRSNAAVFSIEYNNILIKNFEPVESLSILYGMTAKCFVNMPVGRHLYVPFAYNTARGIFALHTKAPVEYKITDIQAISNKCRAFNYYIRNYKDSLEFAILDSLNKFDLDIIYKYLGRFDKPIHKGKAQLIEYKNELIMANKLITAKLYDAYFFHRKLTYDFNIRYTKNKFLVPNFKSKDYMNPMPIFKKKDIDYVMETGFLTYRRAFNEYANIYNFNFSKIKNTANAKVKKFLESAYTRITEKKEFYIDDDFDNFIIIKTMYNKLKIYKDLFAIYDCIIIPPIKGMQIFIKKLLPNIDIIQESDIKNIKSNKRILKWVL